MVRGRAQRRWERLKLIERLKRIARHSWGYLASEFRAYRDPNWAQKGADHPDECDHWFCKSPRKWAKGEHKLTMHERRQLLKDGIDERQ